MGASGGENCGGSYRGPAGAEGPGSDPPHYRRRGGGSPGTDAAARKARPGQMRTGRRTTISATNRQPPKGSAALRPRAFIGAARLPTRHWSIPGPIDGRYLSLFQPITARASAPSSGRRSADPRPPHVLCAPSLGGAALRALSCGVREGGDGGLGLEDGGFRGAGLGFYGQSSGVERAGGLELGGFGVPGLGAGFWGARGRFGGMRVGGFGAQVWGF